MRRIEGTLDERSLCIQQDEETSVDLRISATTMHSLYVDIQVPWGFMEIFLADGEDELEAVGRAILEVAERRRELLRRKKASLS